MSALLAAATPAFADDTNGDVSWDQVSHINHQLVKVGEHGDYLLRYKKVNISTNPVGWIAGFYGASAEYAVTENIVVRADANYFKGGVFGDGESGYEVGLSLPIYLKRAYSGPFIEPGVIARGLTHPSYDDSFDGTTTTTTMTTTTDTMVGPEALVGYHWMFDSGLNVAVAAGVARNLNASSSDDAIQPAGYFRVGYAF
nr:hypothetical protein [Kofleriaceae bacterium]